MFEYDRCETIKIKSGDGDYAIINAEDFNEKEHTLFDDAEEVLTETPTSKVAKPRGRPFAKKTV